MQIVGSPPHAAMPGPELFRSWLREALIDLSISATALARELDLGKNTLSDFLRISGRDLHLGTANVVHSALVERAGKSGVILAPLSGGARG